jgi:hypothetical protein
MIKKSIILGIFTISFLLLTNPSFAQAREEMPKEVQVKMDSNRMEGLPIWNGINFIFEVSVEGLELSERQILLDRAKDIKEIISVDFSSTGNVIIVVPGGTDFVIVKPIFQVIVTGITSIQTTGELKQD